MVRVGIIGATGAVGEGLIRVLLRHPQAELAFLGSDHAAGRPIAEVLPALGGLLDQVCQKPELNAIAREADVVLMAKKGPESLEWAPKLLDAGLKVIDCGGEFRFRDPATYERFYGNPHTCPELLAEAVFGLPEIHREELRSARLVGNAGCYPACALLPLVPLVADRLVSPRGIVVDAYSGLSGAGRTYSPKSRNLFIECNENCRAYSPLTHRHAPEIEQELTLAAGAEATVAFVPHLLPTDRGILTTIFADVAEGTTTEQVVECWRRHYAHEPFIRIRESLDQVELANVQRTNFCDFAAIADPRTGKLVIASALDNVVKGACGNAVQVMNILFDLPETAGLLAPAM